MSDSLVVLIKDSDGNSDMLSEEETLLGVASATMANTPHYYVANHVKCLRWLEVWSVLFSRRVVSLGTAGFLDKAVHYNQRTVASGDGHHIVR